MVDVDQDRPEIGQFDNDVTSLYKWAKFLEIPTQLIIIRPRLPEDTIQTGTENYVFEALPDILLRLLDEGKQPNEINEIIKSFKRVITVDDIIMVYFDILKQRSSSPISKDLYKQVNAFYRALNPDFFSDKFDSNNHIENIYNTWHNELLKLLERDNDRLDTILQIQKILTMSNTEDNIINYTPVIINSTIISFRPTWNGKYITKEDGIDIFNSAVVSKYVPFIKYNDKFGNPYYRVFTGNKTETAPNYANTIIPNKHSGDNNTIYMRLWLGDPNGDGTAKLHQASKESFFTVVYHVDTNYLTVEAPLFTEGKKALIKDENIAIIRTQSALPQLIFGEGKEIKVRGEYDMWNVEYDEVSFLDVVLTQPVMNVYLYVEENIRPFALKKRLDVHYRSIYSDIKEKTTPTDEAYISNFASVSVTLNQRYSEKEQSVVIFDNKLRQWNTVIYPAKTPYVHINITQAVSRNIVYDFIRIFDLLMKFYIKMKFEALQPYYTFLPELRNLDRLLDQGKVKNQSMENALIQLTKKPTHKKRDNSNLKQLQSVAPDIFRISYSRQCQSYLQPILIELSELETWKQKSLGTPLANRQIMQYPKDDPRFYFVCPDEKNPYPGFKFNNLLHNKSSDAYVPCCFKRDQVAKESSKYNLYMRGKIPPVKTGAKAEKKITTNKILAPGRIAVLPRSVSDILKRYSPDSNELVRYGTIYSTNSLLHCIFVATNTKDYLNLDNDEARERYVMRFRSHILTLNPNLFKQEMYDYAEEEIIAYISDNSKFFDPALFFRAIEEIFNVNIYVFSPSSNKDESELGIIEIPRSKIFHSRPYRPERPTVLILKTSGSESDALEYPQCELIVDYSEYNTQNIQIFGSTMTNICHNVLQQSYKTLTWLPTSDTTFDVNSNIYYHIDHLSMFSMFRPISQFIDDNGKMRAITFDVGKNNLFTLFTIPSQPENLPANKSIQRISHNILHSAYNVIPTGVTHNTDGLVDGFWYQIMDIVYGEYIPIIPTRDTFNLPNGPSNPLESFGYDLTNRLTKMRRDLNLIIQIVRWLFNLSRYARPIDPIDFANKYIVINNIPVQDSSQFYDFTYMPRALPTSVTIEDSIAYLNNLVPTFFTKDHIIMYDKLFADRIVKMLFSYYDLYPDTPDFSNIPIVYIDDYYEKDSDFSFVPYSKVFIGDKDLKSWLDSLKAYQNYSQFFNIRPKIDINQSFTLDPFIYQDEFTKIYIIQNVVGGLIEKCFTVADSWLRLKINLGSDVTDFPYDTPNYVLYALSPTSTIVPIEDYSNNDPNHFKILYYGTLADRSAGKDGRYAAILEIL